MTSTTHSEDLPPILVVAGVVALAAVVVVAAADGVDAAAEFAPPSNVATMKDAHSNDRKQKT